LVFETLLIRVKSATWDSLTGTEVWIERDWKVVGDGAAHAFSTASLVEPDGHTPRDCFEIKPEEVAFTPPTNRAVCLNEVQTRVHGRDAHRKERVRRD